MPPGSQCHVILTRRRINSISESYAYISTHCMIPESVQPVSSTVDDVLTCARESAAKKHDYNYAATRRLIENKFQAAFGGKLPYSWQVDVTEALLLSLDCVVVAGTGSGKTMPFKQFVVYAGFVQVQEPAVHHRNQRFHHQKCWTWRG